MGLGISAGAFVGRYRLIGELGQGGTATVFLASATGPAGFNKLVVLKTMKPQFSSEPGFAEMFMSEARLAARLNHPNIVQTYEVLEHDGLPVIVMEYLEGKSLADIAAARSVASPLQLHHDLFVISEALSGLHYSHELADYEGEPLHLVHRDMTPHNVFVTYEGQVKILDFGIAKLSDTTLETETGVVKGKLRYIPPEQIVGEHVDRRADIYSVGVMLWEAAVGEKMWRGVSDAVVMNRVVNEEIPSPSQKGAHVAPELETLVMKALSPNPSDRHPTALALQQDLDAFRKTLGETPTSRTLGPALKRMFDVERTETKRVIEKRLSVPPPPAIESDARGAGAKRSVYAGLAVSVAVVGALGAWWLGRAAHVSLEPSMGGATDAARSPQAVSHREVRVTAFPRSAQIEVDGVLAFGNPVAMSLPLDDREHQLRVRAPGFESQTLAFRLDAGDVETVVRLRPGAQPHDSAELSSEASPPSNAAAASTSTGSTSPKTDAPGTGATAAPVPSATPEAVAPDDCDPPYVIDGRGIKRFKEKCMP